MGIFAVYRGIKTGIQWCRKRHSPARIMKIFALLILAMIAFNANAYGPLPPEYCTKTTAKAVRDKIERMGVKSYLAYSQPNAEHSEWECIINNISSGREEWLALVPVIAAATDAGSADDLSSAMGIALQSHAAAVLGVIDDSIRPISIAEVCTLPFYSGSEADINLTIVKTIRALYQAENGKKCLSALIRTLGQSDEKTFYLEN